MMAEGKGLGFGFSGVLCRIQLSGVGEVRGLGFRISWVFGCSWELERASKDDSKCSQNAQDPKPERSTRLPPHSLKLMENAVEARAKA